MSSSVFIESSSQPVGDSNDYANTSDSNLVVVYGKNGIRFDDKGLENLIGAFMLILKKSILLDIEMNYFYFCRRKTNFFD